MGLLLGNNDVSESIRTIADLPAPIPNVPPGENQQVTIAAAVFIGVVVVATVVIVAVVVAPAEEEEQDDEASPGCSWRWR